MALDLLIKSRLQDVAQAFQDYALSQEWGPDDYQVLVGEAEEWSPYSPRRLLFLARAFSGRDLGEVHRDVLRFVNDRLQDKPGGILFGHDLAVNTVDQARSESVLRNHLDLNDLLITGIPNRHREEAERQRAAAEQQRLHALEVEVADLKARLATLEQAVTQPSHP